MSKNSILASENADIITLSPSEGTELIVGLYNAGAYTRTPLFRGAPGIGKTTFVQAAAAKLRESDPDFGYREVNPTMPADEVGGIPDLVRQEGQATRTDYAMPSWFPMDPEWKGIICLDDAMQGDKQMQTTLANLIQARNLRGHPLPEGAMLVATGNRAEDNAGSGRMLTHLGDRMTLFNVEADPKAWIDDFAIPKGVDPRIIAYIKQYPSKLNMFNAKQEKGPTSRTWAAVSTRMAYIDSLKDSPLYEKFAQAIFVGELGMAEGCLFWSYCNIWGQVPDLDDILANPTTASIDYSVDIRHATAVSLAAKMDVTNFENALTYVDRISSDWTAMVVKLGTSKNPDLQETDAFTNWCVKNQELVHGLAN